VSNKYTFQWAIAGLVLFIIAGCEVIIPNQFDVDEQVALQKFGGVPLQKLIQDAQQKLDRAKKDQIYFLSPNNYQTATKSLHIMRAYAQKPEKQASVFVNAYRLNLALDEGYAVKKIVLRELGDAIQLRDALDELNAGKTHHDEYLRQINNLIRLIEHIEIDKEKMFNTPSARASFMDWKKDIIQHLQDFRSRVVRFNYLGQGDTLVADAEENGAKSIAPMTYAKTIQQRDSAVNYINNNLTDLKGVFKVGKQYYNAAKRLMLITQEINSMTLQGGDSREQYVLRVEQLFASLAHALKIGDISNESFAIQTDKLSQAAVDIISNNEQATDSSRSGTTKPVGKVIVTEKEPDKNKTSIAAKRIKDPGSQFPAIKGIPSTLMNSNDVDEMKKNIRLLTDQIYQLAVEKNEWTSERMFLLDKIAKLKKQIDGLNKPQTKK